MYAFPIDEQISWEGHTAGLIAGLVFALIFRKEIVKVKRYKWEEPNYNEEEDEFLKYFDESGNFIELPPENEWFSETSEISSEISDINYIFKENKD